MASGRYDFPPLWPPVQRDAPGSTVMPVLPGPEAPVAMANAAPTSSLSLHSLYDTAPLTSSYFLALRPDQPLVPATTPVAAGATVVQLPYLDGQFVPLTQVPSFQQVAAVQASGLVLSTQAEEQQRRYWHDELDRRQQLRERELQAQREAHQVQRELQLQREAQERHLELQLLQQEREREQQQVLRLQAQRPMQVIGRPPASTLLPAAYDLHAYHYQGRGRQERQGQRETYESRTTRFEPKIETRARKDRLTEKRKEEKAGANSQEKQDEGNRSNPEQHASKIVGGYIFGCTNRTREECFQRRLFGVPRGHRTEVESIGPGTPLFLFNYNTRALEGVFRASCQGGFELEPGAWSRFGSFPAQVRFEVERMYPTLCEEELRAAIPEIFFQRHKFNNLLSPSQADELVEFFRTKGGEQPTVKRERTEDGAMQGKKGKRQRGSARKEGVAREPGSGAKGARGEGPGSQANGLERGNKGTAVQAAAGTGAGGSSSSKGGAGGKAGGSKGPGGNGHIVAEVKRGKEKAGDLSGGAAGGEREQPESAAGQAGLAGVSGAEVKATPVSEPTGKQQGATGGGAACGLGSNGTHPGGDGEGVKGGDLSGAAGKSGGGVAGGGGVGSGRCPGPATLPTGQDGGPGDAAKVAADGVAGAEGGSPAAPAGKSGVAKGHPAGGCVAGSGLGTAQAAPQPAGQGSGAGASAATAASGGAAGGSVAAGAATGGPAAGAMQGGAIPAAAQLADSPVAAPKLAGCEGLGTEDAQECGKGSG